MLTNHSRRRRYRGVDTNRSWRFRVDEYFEEYDLARIDLLRVMVRDGMPAPGSLIWLTDDIRPKHKYVPVHSVAFDIAQDLVILVHFRSEYAVEDGDLVDTLTAFPIRLSESVRRGYSQAHPNARQAAIEVPFDIRDYQYCEDFQGPTADAKICGPLLALRTSYTNNWRVIIYNWQTGERLAWIDSVGDFTDARLVHARWTPSPRDGGGPQKVAHFAWLTPDSFLISNCAEYDAPTGRGRGIWLYRLDSRIRREPLYQCVALELPRWDVDLVDDMRDVEVHSGTWDEAIYPGALSSNALKQVVVMVEWTADQGGDYHLVYIFRSDVLFDLLARHNGRTYRWSDWAPRCSRVFEVGRLYEVFVCGWAVLLRYNDLAGHFRVEIVNFNPEVIETGMAPGVLVQGPSVVGVPTQARPDLPFGQGGIRSEHPYMSTHLEHLPGINPTTQFEMLAGSVLYSSDRWATTIEFAYQVAPNTGHP